MSIALVRQAYTEARRLVIAGSLVASGDFRLKKLIAPLEAAGKQAPVFGKIAETAKAVVEGPADGTTTALLELSSLTTAVLNTQGETGLAGELVPLKTTELGGQVMQISARRLKPLLEALSTTGGGRWDTIQEEEKAGLFRDLRLVRPALKAIDDPYSEIGELIANKVLPIYGTAIIPELKTSFDATSSKSGHPRRLTLLHKLDPPSSRELVMHSLEKGSKEVKVAAIACLGPDDLPTLLEFVKAKAQDVRGAAYTALAKVNHPDAVAALDQALSGKDYSLAGRCIEGNASAKLVNLLVPKIRTGLAELSKLKDKKAVSTGVERLQTLLTSIPNGSTPEADQLLLELFAQRTEIKKIKGETNGGADIIETLFEIMVERSAPLRESVIDNHAELEAEELTEAVEAAIKTRPAKEVFDKFSPYLLAGNSKEKKNSNTITKFQAVESAIEVSHYYLWWDTEENEKRRAQFDPRWLDLAVKLEHFDLVNSLARKGHAGALAFAKKQFDEQFKKAKEPDDLRMAVALLMRLGHPDSTEAFFQALSKKKKTTYYLYWYYRKASDLPKSALPRLEEFVGTLPEKETKDWIDAINELRAKPE